jgi:Zn-dependent oligopeptidase
MKLQIKDDGTGPLAVLKTSREKKYEEIDQEYSRKVQEFKKNVWEQEKQVSQTIREIEEFGKEGDTSINQVKQLKKAIELMENQVNQLMMIEQTEISFENKATETNLVNTHVRMGAEKYFVKGRVRCKGIDLYALENERSVKY